MHSLTNKEAKCVQCGRPAVQETILRRKPICDLMSCVRRQLREEESYRGS